MNYRTFIVLVVCLAAGSAYAGPEEAARDVIQRLLPQRAAEFVVETIPAELGKDVFEIESRGGKVVLRGNNGVAITSALNHYLKHSCQCDISWCGDQLQLPAKLPVVTETFTRLRRWRPDMSAPRC